MWHFWSNVSPRKRRRSRLTLPRATQRKAYQFSLIHTCHEKIQRQFTVVQSHDIHRQSSFIALMYLRLHAQSLVYSVKYHLYRRYESLITLHAVLPSNQSRVLPICLHVLTFAWGNWSCFKTEYKAQSSVNFEQLITLNFRKTRWKFFNNFEIKFSDRLSFLQKFYIHVYFYPFQILLRH